MAETLYDVAIIGGGVIGCSILHELSSLNLRCILCEKEDELISGASSGNSGTLHTGFDADFKSRELEYLQQSLSLNKKFFKRYKIPFEQLGAFVVAWSEDDLARLPDLVSRGHLAGVTDVRLVTAKELYEKEPNLNPHALGAVHIPGESIVDPWLIPASLAHIAVSRGATVTTGCAVRDGEKKNDHWLLVSSAGPVKAKVVINCAGLYGDKVESIHRISPFTIKPRKGQFAIFSQSAGHLLNSIILPVPTEKTKGVLLFPTVYANIVVGPTAEDQSDRTKADVDEEMIDNLTKCAHFILPTLKGHPVIGTYAGLRPATEHKDYCIEAQEDNWITVGGIRSTGLSACLGIAKHVASLLPSMGLEFCHNDEAEGIPEMIGRSYCGDGSVEFGGRKWEITHPITKFGISSGDGLKKFKEHLK